MSPDTLINDPTAVTGVMIREEAPPRLMREGGSMPNLPDATEGDQSHDIAAPPNREPSEERQLTPAEESLQIHQTVQQIQDDHVRIEALGVLYEAERLALSGIQSAILTTVVSLLTYIGILGGFLSAMEDVSSLIVPYLPLPAWALGIFFVVQLGQLQAHAKSIKIIERDVVESAGLTPQARFVGTGSERRWTKLSSATPATFVFYATFFISLAIITAVSFNKVVDHYSYWPWTLTMAAVVYLVLTLGIAASIRKLLRAITYPDLDDPED